MSTSRVPVIRRASAQTLSPSSISRTSQGTSSRASISCRVPSRSTLARSGRNAASASTARSACISCTNAKPAFSRMTAAIAIASRGVPLTQASTAATASSTASGWVNCAASSPGQRRLPRRDSSFGPDTSSRRAASRPDRPRGPARRSRNSCVSGSSGSAGPSFCSVPGALSLVPGAPGPRPFRVVSCVVVRPGPDRVITWSSTYLCGVAFDGAGYAAGPTPAAAGVGPGYGVTSMPCLHSMVLVATLRAVPMVLPMTNPVAGVSPQGLQLRRTSGHATLSFSAMLCERRLLQCTPPVLPKPAAIGPLKG